MDEPSSFATIAADRSGEVFWSDRDKRMNEITKIVVCQGPPSANPIEVRDQRSGESHNAMRGSDPAPSDRALWLDVLKVCSILGVIGIHVTADSAGMPYSSFPEAERVTPMMGRAVASLFNYPIFFVVSFFLLAGSTQDGSRSYGDHLLARLRRLVPPFLMWSAIYLVFRNVKAIAFGYQTQYLQEVSTPMSWVNYLLVGSAQYHLHFLPTLIILTLVYPAYGIARRWPIFGLALLAFIALWPQLDAAVYSTLGHRPELLPVALSLTKAVGCSGYGFMAFALYRFSELGRASTRLSIPLGLLVVGAIMAGAASIVILFEASRATASAGEWLARDFKEHLAFYLGPACVTIVFLLLRGRPSTPIWTRLSALSFGVYLFHPIVLDLLEIAERDSMLRPAMTVAFNFVAVTLLSFLIVMLASRVAFLRGLFGLRDAV